MLRPFVIIRLASANFPRPVEAKSDFIQLFAITLDILFGSNCRMLSGLNGVLFGRQAVGVISHGMQYVESFQAFVSGINVGSDVTQRMSDMQAGSRRIGKHVQHIKFRFIRLFFYLVSFVFFPVFQPFFLDFAKIVLHDFCLLKIQMRCKDNQYLDNTQVSNIKKCKRTYRGYLPLKFLFHLLESFEKFAEILLFFDCIY